MEIRQAFLGAFMALVLGSVSQAQQKLILGGGYSQGIKVTTSHNYRAPNWDSLATGQKTLDGSGLHGPALEASRFLAQASLGANLTDINRVMAAGMENWIDEQMTLDPTYILPETRAIFDTLVRIYLERGGNPEEVPTEPYWNVFNYAWWQQAVTGEDKLRHRIALALSELLVISTNSDLGSYGFGLAAYYDIFLKNAFKNYRDVLREVTLHPCMGFYLSHLDNPKTNEEENIHPDENYAREIMQLFTIGLYELNRDGSRKVDASGNNIPTYDQNDIRELAKIFTGLGASAIKPNMYLEAPEFGIGIYLNDLTQPMKMYEEWHEPGVKTILGDKEIPAGNSGMKDIEMALDHLFNHPNVGPFIARHFIQRLVTSNPTPGYIDRVATAFNDNGAGVRGDLKAVIKAVLLDNEARSCASIENPLEGMLREPLVRYTHFAKAMKLEQYYERYWNIGYEFWEKTGQSPLGAPSVFNFFLPDFQPIGAIASQGLVAPEFQIHNTKTSVGYINQVNNWAIWDNVLWTWEEGNPPAWLVLDELLPLARDPEVLLNRLDMLFTHGQLSDRTRSIIKSAISNVIWGDYRDDRIRLALYLIMISPDYAILK